MQARKSNIYRNLPLTFLIALLCSLSLNAQQELDDDGLPHTQYFVEEAEDFIIPLNTTHNSIQFYVKGGDGGRVKIADCISWGGDGAVTEFTVLIGHEANQLPPGTEIRFVVGDGGGNFALDNGTQYGASGGGGGTAILAKINNVWEILAVAGGGGGAYQGNVFGFCTDSQKGQGGRTSTNGSNGAGSLAGSGGSNGNGGNGGGDIGDGDLSGGGGGAFSNGKGSSCTEGKKGYPSGGDGGCIPFSGVSGGWGFGGGGASDESGGGGGGYSGGGGGGLIDNGGGGGSYVNATYAFTHTITAGGNEENTLLGFAIYEFSDVCTATISGFEYINVICSEGTNGRIQLISNLDPANICYSELDYELLPENGHEHLGGGEFRKVKAGDYKANIINKETGFVMSSFSFTADVSDVAPTASCKGATISLNNGTCSNPDFAKLINNGSFSPCDDPLTFSAPTSFNCNNIGETLVILTVTGSNGVSSSCGATVTVLPGDSGIPEARCYANRTYNLNGGTLNLTTGDINNSSILGACFSEMSISPSSFNCDDVGQHIVTLTIDAGPGNSSSCTSNVTITDNALPTAICKTPEPIQLDANGLATITVADVDDGSFSNNCSAPVYSLSQSSFDCSDVGDQLITLTVSDGKGNDNSCTAVVTIKDDIAPSSSCQDISIALDANGSYTLDPALLDNGSTDNCAFSLSTSKTAFDCSDIGMQAVTLTLTDEHGNQSACTATVSVVDNTPPEAICRDYTVSINAGSISIAAYTSQATTQSFDNCSGALTTTLLSSPLLDCDDIGPTLITYEVKDQSNNTSTCTSVFTVEDNSGPSAYCQDLVIQLDDTGSASITPEQVDDESYDNCGITNYSLSQSTFDCTHIGNNLVSLTVTDPNGFTSTCQATITVEDQTGPVALCREEPLIVVLGSDGTAQISYTDIDAGSYDLCFADLTYLVTQPVFSCLDIGNTSVNLIVSNSTGSTSSCQTTIVVEDQTPPVIFCQENPLTVALGPDGTAQISYLDITGGGYDICSNEALTYTLNQSNFECAHASLSPIDVTMTVTDKYGNASACSRVVNVVDEIMPTISCQDITLDLTDPENSPFTGTDINNLIVSLTDNCSGVDFTFIDSKIEFGCHDIASSFVVTLQAIDRSNNTSTCTATVTVADPNDLCNQAPSAICQDIEVSVADACTASITAAQVDNGSSDPNGDALTFTLDNSNPLGIGTHSVLLTVSDGQLSDQCTASVTVKDEMAPTAFCQDISVDLNAEGKASITAADIDCGSSDNCNIAELIATPNTFTGTNLGANTVTLTVSDDSGNSSTCTSTVTINPVLIAYVWDDLDGDGKQDAEEPAIKGAEVDLINKANGTVLQHRVANENGEAIFSTAGIAAHQKLLLKFYETADHRYTLKDKGHNDHKDSDANRSTGRTKHFTVDADGVTDRWDCGLWSPGDIEAFVWNDLDGDGKQDASEPGLEGVTVYLLEKNNGLIGSTVTDVDGLANFYDVPADRPIKLQFQALQGFRFTAKDKGKNDNKDSDANPSNGRTKTFAASKGQQLFTTWDAGLVADGYAAARDMLPSSSTPITDPDAATELALDIFPNPFSDQTIIQFYLSEVQAVRVEIFNLQGQSVQRLDIGWLDAGEHRQVWDGTANGQQLDAGMYIIRLQAGRDVITKKVTLVR